MTSEEIEEAIRRISSSGVSIYDELGADDPRYFDTHSLEMILLNRLRGLTWAYPIRTRAKVAKTAVCEALGYPVPRSFKKTQPRYPGQDFDLYVQKSNNLQIWNEEVAPNRRYVLIRLNSADEVVGVRVLTGEEVARFDRTGTLTSKYQAKRRDDRVADHGPVVLASEADTSRFHKVLVPTGALSETTLQSLSPVAAPKRSATFSISGLVNRLGGLIGTTTSDPGLDQERNRGAELHRAVCGALGLGSYADHGQFPDIKCQALEVKLQTSPTIDLGLVSPDSEERIDGLEPLRHCDMRYAVFYGENTDPETIMLTGLVVVTGADFFTEFRRFGGLVQNRKLQIPLPEYLFDPAE